MTRQAYTYYPGCSLQHRSHAYESSNRNVAQALGFDLVEMDDWNCCGATEYFSLNRLPAYALVARNLARAANEGADELVVPCSACFLNLHKTDKQMAQYPDLARSVNQALAAGDLHYTPGTVRVRHLVEVIISDIGFTELATRITRPLYGLKLAAYYGCLIARPDSIFDSTEHPTTMDRLFEVLGAESVPFALKTFCCGGHMAQISAETGFEMIHKIVKNAAENGADAIVTVCPMCQLNLDVYQDSANKLFDTDYQVPILFFTQVLGLALGLKPSDLGIGQEFVDAMPAINKISEVPPPKPKRERRDKQALPMPVMPE